MKLWIGIDKEGFNRGKKTLFIGDKNISFITIKNTINEYKDIKQLYFGAGECTKINTEVLNLCIQNFKQYIITAEIELNDLHTYNKKLLQKIFIIITITNKNINLIKDLEYETLQIKLQTLRPKENRFLSIGKYKYFIETELKNYLEKVYDDDVVLL